MDKPKEVMIQPNGAAPDAGGVTRVAPKTCTMTVLEARELGGDSLVGSEFWLGGVLVRVVSAGKAYFAHTNTPVVDLLVVPVEHQPEAFSALAKKAGAMRRSNKPKPEA